MTRFIFLGGFWSNIGDAISAFFFRLLLWINAIIYSFISLVYQIFLVLAHGGSIFESSAINGFVSRIYVVIGVVILFLVAYSLLKSMANPEEGLKGKKSPINIIKDVIISIVLIAFMPTIFDFAFLVQDSFLNNNVIGKLIAGSATGDAQDTIRMGGYTMASTIWKTFLIVEDGYCDVEDETIQDGVSVGNSPDCELMRSENGVTYGEMWAKAKENTTFFDVADAADFIADDKITYLMFFDIIAGAFVLFVLLSYCLDMALRLVKLAVYELIAPLPILGRIIPNETVNKMFNNWLKATLSTFAEVFIRIAILYFAVLIISTVGKSIDNVFAAYTLKGTNFLVKTIAQALIIIGIILFVKQAPNIIKEITGLDGGKYNVLGSTLMTAAALGGITTAAVQGFNAKDQEGNQKKIWNRFASALAGGASAGTNSMWHSGDIKDFKSMNSNMNNAIENATNRRINRENRKYSKIKDREAYIEGINAEIEKGNEEYGTDVAPIKSDSREAKRMYRAHRNSEKVREWAGISDYNPKAVSRISELADKIDSNFSALENTWKKVQSFIDAKSETERLENELAHYQTVFNQEFEKVMKDNNFHSDNQKEVEKARELANENMMKQFGTNLIIAQDKFNRAKINKDNIERTEKNKKAEAIANAARNIQQATAQYSDVLIAKDKILARETDVSKRAAMEQAIARYGNLSNKDAYDRLVADIRSGVKEANDYIDYLDKYNQEARQEKANQQFQEQQRASSVSKSGGKGNGEKH